MEERELNTIGEITSKFISSLLIYGLIFGILYSIIYNFILVKLLSNSLIFLAITTIFFHGLILYIIFRFTNTRAFKRISIVESQVKELMKNIAVLLIVFFVINAVSIFSNISAKIDEELNSNFSLNYSEKLLNSIYSNSQMDEYYKEKKNAISKVKSQLYMYFFFLETGLFVIYVFTINWEKKYLLQYARKKNE